MSEENLATRDYLAGIEIAESAERVYRKMIEIARNTRANLSSSAVVRRFFDDASAELSVAMDFADFSIYCKLMSYPIARCLEGRTKGSKGGRREEEEVRSFRYCGYDASLESKV